MQIASDATVMTVGGNGDLVLRGRCFVALVHVCTGQEAEKRIGKGYLLLWRPLPCPIRGRFDWALGSVPLRRRRGQLLA